MARNKGLQIALQYYQSMLQLIAKVRATPNVKDAKQLQILANGLGKLLATPGARKLPPRQQLAAAQKIAIAKRLATAVLSGGGTMQPNMTATPPAAPPADTALSRIRAAMAHLVKIRVNLPGAKAGNHAARERVRIALNALKAMLGDPVLKKHIANMPPAQQRALGVLLVQAHQVTRTPVETPLPDVEAEDEADEEILNDDTDLEPELDPEEDEDDADGADDYYPGAGGGGGGYHYSGGGDDDSDWFDDDDDQMFAADEDSEDWVDSEGDEWGEEWDDSQIDALLPGEDLPLDLEPGEGTVIDQLKASMRAHPYMWGAGVLAAGWLAYSRYQKPAS